MPVGQSSRLGGSGSACADPESQLGAVGSDPMLWKSPLLCQAEGCNSSRSHRVDKGKCLQTERSGTEERYLSLIRLGEFSPSPPTPRKDELKSSTER